MARNNIDVEWRIGEEHWDDQAWQPDQSREVRSLLTRRERRLLVQMARGLSLAAVFLFLATSRSHSALEQTFFSAHAEIQSLLEREYHALIGNDREAYYRLVADPRMVFNVSGWFDLQQVPSDQRSQIRFELLDLRLEQDLALATVKITPPASHWIPVAYLETRFFRPSAEGWQRVAAPGGYWGEWQAVETANLRFEFYARDAETVSAVLPEIESTYARLRRDMHLPAPSRRSVFTVQPRFSRWSSSSGYRGSILSPSLLRIPAARTSADRIGDVAAEALTNRVLGDVLSVYELYYLGEWYSVLIGIRNWYMEHYFGRAPYWLAAGQERLRAELPGYFPLRLTDLTGPGQINPRHRFVRYAAGQALAEYVAAAYGPDYLEQMLRALSSESSWETLIPEVFGRSVHDFSVDWNLYMARAYGIGDRLE